MNSKQWHVVLIRRSGSTQVQNWTTDLPQHTAAASRSKDTTKKNIIDQSAIADKMTQPISPNEVTNTDSSNGST